MTTTPYDVSTLRSNVRELLHNVGYMSMADSRLDAALLLGKARLDNDKPNEIAGTITGTGLSGYNLAGLEGWVPGFSVISSILNPTPDFASGEIPAYMGLGEFRTVSLAGQEWLYLSDGVRIASGSTATILYTTPWQIADFDGQLETTLVDRMRAPLHLICAAYVCRTLAARSAGEFSDQVENDIVNWRTAQQEYMAAGDSFMESYKELLQLNGPNGGPPAAIARASYPLRRTDGIEFITHRRA